MTESFPVDVSVVIPVYGGTDALPELCARVDAALRELGLTYEVILVDDRGQSHAWDTITSLAELHREVSGIRLSRNFGQHAATICGISEARGQWIVTMDDDLEHPPEAIGELLAATAVDRPLVYGVFEKRTHASYRNITSELMRWCLKRAFPDMNENYTSFRVIHARLAEQLARFDLNRPYIDGLLSWLTSNAGSVVVPHGQRRHGESTYTLHKLISHATNILVTYSHLPLRIVTYSGGVLSAFSFFYLLYIIGGRLTGHITDPGYTSLMSVVLLACGIQLLILGTLGEYLGRLMGAVYKRPIYSVEQTSRQDASPQLPAQR